MKKEIKDTLEGYLQAVFTKDYEHMYSVLNEEDMMAYRNTVTDFANKMDVFGESQDFMNKLGFQSANQLDQLTLFEFMTSMFEMISHEVGSKNLKKILSGLTITKIEGNEEESIVSYEYPMLLYGEWIPYEGQVQMTKSDGHWQLFFKSGLEAALNKFQEDIDGYFERKNRDKPENLGFEGDLTRFTLIDYRDFASGKVVIEPRYQDASDFNNGLAYVQIMTKYGYINVHGEIAIKPQFIDAREFSQKRAAVQLEVSKNTFRWGFISTNGQLKIAAAYEETSNFSNGRCAVKSNGKWGYIDKKGKEVIPFQFDEAGDFTSGYAYASIYTDDEEEIEYDITKKGKIKELA